MTTARAPVGRRPPRIWMDITTSLRAQGLRPNGTLRVERTLAAGLRSELGAVLAFCSYSRARRRFVAADAAAVAAEPAAFQIPPLKRATSPPDWWGKRLERLTRRTVRGLIRTVRTRFAPRDAAALFPGLEVGDVLLLGGETWSARYDLDVIKRLRREAGLKVAAICQDTIPLTHPQFFQSGEFVTRYRGYVDFLLGDTDLLIVHSKSVKESLEAARGGRQAPPIGIVPLGSDIATDVMPRAPVTRLPLEPGGFVIAVSTIQSRKNFDLLYRVWRRFAEEGHDHIPRLVIVGAPGFGGGELLQRIAEDALVRDSIVVLHDAGDAELAWLYRNCRFTLYPSFAEGWGLPVAESLAYGKPCLASDKTSLPEAGAGLAVHLDPVDFDAWHDTILGWSRDAGALDAMA